MNKTIEKKLAEIMELFRQKGFNCYQNDVVAGTDVDAIKMAVASGPVDTLTPGNSYLILPKVGEGKNTEEISSFMREKCIKQPIFVLGSQKVIEHSFGDNMTDESVLQRGAAVHFNGFRIEEYEIRVIAEEGAFDVGFGEFYRGVEKMDPCPA